ncbi:MAG: metallophosphoesterase family protein [Heyndrickxia sp.]
MTKFIYLTDSHIGASKIGFHQQPAHPNILDCLVKQLQKVITNSQIEFIIHGGDMVDHCSEGNIQMAKSYFSPIKLPIYLLLGNHDLDEINALQFWMENAPNFFLNRSPQYSIVRDDFVIHVVPNHWEKEVLYYWKEEQIPYFTEEQLDDLEQKLQYYSDRVNILATHNPMFGVFPEQTGLKEVIHDVPECFRARVIGLMKRYDQFKLVLSGHNHINTLVNTAEGIFVSHSSFIEEPFEYKMIDISKTHISIETHSLGQYLQFKSFYCPEKSFVQGQRKDRFICREV